MTAEKLARKAELYFRLHGIETAGSLSSCYNCRLWGKCISGNKRCIIIQWDENGHWTIDGYGLAFGVFDGPKIFSYCVEFLDNKE